MQIPEFPPARGVPIIDAKEPIAVRVKLALNNGKEHIVPAAWAMAWTSSTVLVYWRDPQRGPFLVWLPAARVRRRDSPVR